jgi:glyoxylase-like metal-dependent hydrolase (beta-lactamase superfamily II)/8-oxo-dGTP pyrophosphatase MutT (NUDIX family)
LSEPSLYERVMAAAAEAAPAAPKPPRPSASVVLWRRTGGGEGEDDLEVYWVRRAETLAFMGGWHAFPGGGLSRADVAVPMQGMPEGLVEGASSAGDFPASLLEGVDEPEPDLVPGLLACAVRELFEETGVLLAEELLPGRATGPVASADRLAESRRLLVAGERRFPEVVADLGLTPDASPLVFAGRWLTPPLGPFRFDNRFFLLHWPRRAALQPAIVPGEIVEGEWLPPAEAVERWREGTVIAAPPILHLLRVLAEDGPEAGLGRLRHPSDVDLGPFRRIEFRPGVILLPLATPTLPPAERTNAYLLGSGGERLLIDPGTPFEGEIARLLAALRALESSGEGRVTAIWLTHHHPDHVGAVEAVRRALSVPVAAHVETARRLATRGIAVDRELADGERVVLAGDPPFPVRAIHTPGHARGHLCFFDEEGGSLIAGDMVAGFGTMVIDPPEGDMDDYLASLAKLVDLAPRTLFPAHGPPLADAVGSLRQVVDHRRWREERVLAAWRSGLREPGEMLPTVYDDAPERAWALAERQIVAHLDRLRRAGRIAG